jgi:hypothetical protein
LTKTPDVLKCIEEALLKFFSESSSPRPLSPPLELVMEIPIEPLPAEIQRMSQKKLCIQPGTLDLMIL